MTPKVAGEAGLPGMPPVLDSDDVWAADRPGQLSPVVAKMPTRVYVPNSGSDTVIDPVTFKVLKTVPVGDQPQHVVPSWDLKTLWVNNDLGNSLTPINPKSGRFGKSVSVHDPYNLYFTPDGISAVVMASADRQIVFRDPHAMKVQKKIGSGCDGVNHADFSTDGRYFLVSCEFDGQLLKVDTAKRKIIGRIHLHTGNSAMAKPQDVKLSTDGRVFYVADMMRNGMWLIDGKKMKVTGFIKTGKGTHGLYITRDSRKMLITNRDEGSISVLNLATRKLVAKWTHGGSPVYETAPAHPLRLGVQAGAAQRSRTSFRAVQARPSGAPHFTTTLVMEWPTTDVPSKLPSSIRSNASCPGTTALWRGRIAASAPEARPARG